MKARVNRLNVELRQGDIFTVPAAAVVLETDTNLSLEPDALRRAGPDVQQACREIGWCAVGAAVITFGGWLPFERIIHAVGPRWGEGTERARLAQVTAACLRLAEANRLKSAVFPPISTGARGYPVENCARTMLSQIVDYSFESLKHLRTIIVCVDSSLVFDTFHAELTRQLASLSQDSSGPAQVRA